ncbi:hypothetical protein SK803_19590 [Lentzea sp. BCCO 10_0856]|uniref:Uncharacterized protein n=1 Tax=Lentzea miocenica TaxID=3095431 RepID=A0ABU4T2Y5_9PSEU|nr:hypothetical protein [Lentzea sp. BCCO 10_0856]MDX8032424.1 hypothetical protein [Lentzea sp. BCCO 10_0856]
MPLEHVELAELDVPDDPRTRAHFAELTRPGGRELEPADTYEARDPSGFVIVTVNKDRKVTNVRIRARWYEHLRPEHFPAALYNTYVTAVQRAFAVEFAHRPPDQPAAPAPDAGFVDPADLSQEEWEARTAARINAMADQYDAIRRQQQQPKLLEVTDIRSPLGYLTLHVRAGGPVAIHGDPQALDNPSDTVLSEDALQMFVRAGLGIDPGERPPAQPRGGGGSDTDDEYFSDFNVLRARDWNG